MGVRIKREGVRRVIECGGLDEAFRKEERFREKESLEARV